MRRWGTAREKKFAYIPSLRDPFTFFLRFLSLICTGMFVWFGLSRLLGGRVEWDVVVAGHDGTAVRIRHDTTRLGAGMGQFGVELRGCWVFLKCVVLIVA